MHLHNKTVLISPINSELINTINILGISTVLTACIENLIPYERYHADMQALRIDDTLFVPQNVESLIEKLSVYNKNICICKKLEHDYPNNVSLNAASVGEVLLCKIDALAPEVLEFCAKKNIRLINVNQGYAKCSTLILNENAVITSDKTVYKAALDLGIDVLLIRQGYIYLDDNTCGFIGGASGVIGKRVLFFGDLDTHPDAISIKLFLKKHKMEYISLCSGKLIDIGGFVLLN